MGFLCRGPELFSRADVRGVVIQEGLREEPLLLHIEEPVEETKASRQDASLVRCSEHIPPGGDQREDAGDAEWFMFLS